MKFITYLIYLLAVLPVMAVEHPISTSAKVSKTKVRVGETVTVSIEAKNTTRSRLMRPRNVKDAAGRWVIDGGGISFSRSKDGLCVIRNSITSTPPTIRWLHSGDKNTFLLTWIPTVKDIGQGYLLINPPVGFQPVKPMAITVVDKQPDKNAVLKELERQITELHERKIKSMPKGILQKISECESLDKLNQLDLDAQRWLHQNFCQSDSVEMGNNFEKLEEIRLGDDVYTILSHTFWCKVKGRPIELKKRVALIGLYWKENDWPNIKTTPEGGGGIKWIWKLEVATRTHGILHVGLDVKTRKFICYELPVGIYYPEGEVLERIRAEIVQDPGMAGSHLGKGRFKKLNEEQQQPSPESP